MRVIKWKQYTIKNWDEGIKHIEEFDPPMPFREWCDYIDYKLKQMRLT